ncbi:MAG: hypothetical protein KC766_33295 [Myxococcales bacterium]|nr:hypothetical protein [Myxococcales bacterium]
MTLQQSALAGIATLLLAACGGSDDASGSAGSGSGGEAGTSVAGSAGTTAGGASNGGAATGGTSGAGPRRCNGHAALCDRPFDQVAFATTHNSMSNADEGWLAPNQEHGLERQLADGIRGMLLDTHDLDGVPYLCHSACSLGKRELADALSAIVAFLQAHPSEVLAFLIEDYVSPSDTAKVFDATGLSSFVYAHPDDAPWPTLGQMIDMGQRLVVMAQEGAPPPAWYLHLWDEAWDTPYSFENVDEFSCAANRGSRDNALFLLNHWVENPLPNQTESAKANQFEVLLGRAEQCHTESGKFPNFIAVNHYASGDLFRVVDALNGVGTN